MGWYRDASHFPRPVTAALAELYCVPAERGYADGARRYGLGLSGWQVRAPAGVVYVRPLPTIDAAEVADREAAARASLLSRRWRADAARWRDEERPRWQALIRTTATNTLPSLTDAALADHVEAVAALIAAGVHRHFELHLADMLPFGRLLVAGRRRGLPVAELIERTRGLSPASGRAQVPTWSVVGRLDIDAPTLAETGAAIRSMTMGQVERPEPFGDADLDDLLDDVVATFWVRDDNAGILLAEPVGLLRLALLEAGARLGLHAIEATASEAAALLRGEPGPGTRDLAEREAARVKPVVMPVVDAPDPDGAVGQPGPASTELTAAMLAYDELYDATESRGVGVGGEVARGRAVVAQTPDEAVDRMGARSVLVVRTTAPAFDPVLALATAIVCEDGGLLSHAALAARELKLPAVLGLAGATTAIPDGAEVEVDPTVPEVRVLPLKA